MKHQTLPKYASLIFAAADFILSRKVFSLALAAFVLLPSGAFAQNYLHTNYNNSGCSENGGGRDQEDLTASSLSDEFTGVFDSGNVRSIYGSVHTLLTANVPPHPGSWSVCVESMGSWNDVITLTSPGYSGPVVARLIAHLDGDLIGSSSGDGYFSAAYALTTQAGPYGGILNSAGFSGTPPSALRTITYDQSTSFDQGTAYLQVTGELRVDVTASGTNSDPHGCDSPCRPGGGNATSDLLFGVGHFTLFDNQNNTLDYTAESHTGSARGSNIPAGGPYAGFNLTNNAPGRIGTTLSLLDGTASAATNVTAAFVAPPTPKAASDVIELNGTGNDPFVVQMSFDPNAPSYFGSFLFQLCWLPEGSTRWVNATLGNYQGPPPHFVGNRAYNSSTDFHLGYFGLDPANKVAWAVINHNSVYAVSVPLDLVSVVSRKTHGAAGNFDINLPLAGAPGVECRTGPNYTLVFAFTRNLTSGSASVTSGAGSVSATPTISENTITVNLSGVTNAQTTAVTVHGLTDLSSQVLPDTAVSMTTLIGDTSANKLVTSTDVSQTKLQSGQAVTSGNFREDINANGTINGTDVSIAKLNVGSGVP
jgi:hypothetical protein